MKQTEKLKLNKPDYEDIADIAKLNENSDILDKEVDDRLSKSKGGTVKGVVSFEGDGCFKNLQAEKLTGSCLDSTVADGSEKPVTSGAVAERLKSVSPSDHTHTRFDNSVEIGGDNQLAVKEITGRQGILIKNSAGTSEIEITKNGVIKISCNDSEVGNFFNIVFERNGELTHLLELSSKSLSVSGTLRVYIGNAFYYNPNETQRYPDDLNEEGSGVFHLYKEVQQGVGHYICHNIIPSSDNEFILGDSSGDDRNPLANRFRCVYTYLTDTHDVILSLSEWLSPYSDKDGGKGSEYGSEYGSGADGSIKTLLGEYKKYLLNEVPKLYLGKKTAYYDKNPIGNDADGNPLKSVEMVEKPVYFGYPTVHNGDLFTHKILPELSDKQYTIGMANIPYYGGYFKNLYADNLYKIDGTPYIFEKEIPIELRCTEYRYIDEDAPDKGQAYVTAVFTSVMTYTLFNQLFMTPTSRTTFSLFGLESNSGTNAPRYVKVSPDNSNYSFYPQVGLVTDDTDTIQSIRFTIRDSGFTYVGDISETLVPIEDFVAALQNTALPKVSETIDLNGLTGTLSVEKGGTGAGTASQARTNLGLKDASTKSYTTSVASGNTSLPTSDAVYKEIQRVKDELESDDTIIKESISNNSDEITSLRSDYESQIETLYDIINALQNRVDSIEGSQTATVTYYVRHYRQDADTGNYTLFATDTKTGNSGSLVTAVFSSYPNYRSNDGKSKKSGTLSSGSTLYLDLYYDLVTYTVSYNLDGGTGANGVSYASESIRHGAKITTKAAPTKSNYVFKHWLSASSTYGAGQQITVTSTVTFKAVYEADNSDTRDYTNVFDISDNDGLVRGQQKSFNAEHTSTSFQVKTGDKIDLFLSYGLHCDGIQTNLEYELYGDASLSCLGESISLGLNYSHEPNGSESGNTDDSTNKSFIVSDEDNGKYLDVSVHADQPMGSNGSMGTFLGAINDFTATVTVNGKAVYNVSA